MGKIENSMNSNELVGNVCDRPMTREGKTGLPFPYFTAHGGTSSLMNSYEYRKTVCKTNRHTALST